jgi:hypothetical protein
VQTAILYFECRLRVISVDFDLSATCPIRSQSRTWLAVYRKRCRICLCSGINSRFVDLIELPGRKPTMARAWVWGPHRGGVPNLAASLAVRSTESWGMPVLTRRNPDARQESWQVYYGDVRVGSIAMRSGNPADTALRLLSGQPSKGMHVRHGRHLQPGARRFRGSLAGLSRRSQRPTSTNIGSTAPGQRGNTRCGIRDASCPRN